MLASSVLQGQEAAQSGAEVEVSGTIESMAQAVIDGNSHFYLTLEGDSAIYDVELPGLVDIVRYGVGDQVTLGYAKPSGGKNDEDEAADASGLRTVTSLGGKRAKPSAGADESGAEGSEVSGAEASRSEMSDGGEQRRWERPTNGPESWPLPNRPTCACGVLRAWGFFSGTGLLCPKAYVGLHLAAVRFRVLHCG